MPARVKEFRKPVSVFTPHGRAGDRSILLHYSGELSWRSENKGNCLRSVRLANTGALVEEEPPPEIFDVLHGGPRETLGDPVPSGLNIRGCECALVCDFTSD